MKNKIFFFPVLILILSAYSCKKQNIEESLVIDKEGVVLKQPYLWKTSLSDKDYICIFVYPSLVTDDNILMGAYKNKKTEIALLNIETGEKQWQKPYDDKECCSISDGFQRNNLAVIDAENAKFKGINIETGEFLWSFDKQGWFWPTAVNGIDNTFFLCGQTETVNKPYELTAAWVGNIETGETQEFFVPDITAIADTSTYVRQHENAGGVRNIIPYDKNGNIYLLIYYSTNFKEYGEHFICLYDFTEKVFVYKDKKLSSGNWGDPFIANDNIYLTLTDGVYCYDLFTGEKKWQNSFSIPYGKVYAANKLYGINHGIDSYLVGIDLNNGNQLWKVPSVQCIAPMRYLNGIVYFVSSANYKLHAYEASTGKELWRIESPDYAHDSGAFFKPECTVVPGKNGEKGKVIVSSYLNGFCYEAAR
jgi:outer membrane protein assembly factor BamB